ncbi:MAG TPA: ABC transporter ATP-binding protein [Cyclobacteriaceae bacterium]|nr:ABC transporter ATP-binding protein [Cyclobacteriaceae bacterium]
MKTFFRILQYSGNIRSRVILFLLFSTLGVMFTAVSLVSIQPMMQVLFDKVEVTTVPAMPEFSFSAEYFIGVFRHHFTSVLVEYGKAQALLFVCGFIAGAVLIGNTFRYMERIIASKVRLDVVKNLRSAVFRNITRMQVSFFNNHRKGDLLSRFTNDVSEVESAVMNSLKAVLKEPITLIVYFGALFYISTKLTLFTLIVVPVIGGVLGEIVRRLKKQAPLSQASLGRVVSILEETFGGMRVVKAFNARSYVVAKMEEENNYNNQVNMSMAYKNEMASPVSEFLGVCIVSLVVFFGGKLVMTGELEAATFFSFLALFASIIQPVKSFAQGITQLQKGVASARRIFEVTDLQPAIEDKPGAIELKEFDSSIEFRNVSFAYDQKMVLRNVDMTIAKGKTVALVGPSGGGKSTIADLVPRFYDVTSGDVLMDGKPLKDYQIESLRKQMGIVTQESILFNDSIYNNIAFGIQTATRESVIGAARIANAHDFIMQTENGYDTVIGERGSKLSGGQRQRLSIARAVLKNPPILIMDEATSALDSESEKLVQEALFNLMRNRTSLVIAHRLSTIQHADEIVVVQEGRIVERGTHAQLMGRDGLYRKLNEIQNTDSSL